MNENLLRGALFLSIAWIFGTVMSVFAKLAFPITNIWPILFAQSSISFICTLPWSFSHIKKIRAFSSWRLIAIRTTTGLIAYFFLFLGVHKTALVNAILMNNTAPIFIPFVSLIWLSIHIKPKLWWGIVIGFVGIVLILKPDSSILKEIGVLYALIAGVMLAIIQVCIRELAQREKPVAILFYYFLFGAIITAGPTIAFWPSPSPLGMLYLLGAGLGMFFFQLFSIIAFSHARPVKIGSINYVAIVYSAILGWMIWNETIDWVSWLGILSVISGGLITIYFGRHDKKA